MSLCFNWVPENSFGPLRLIQTNVMIKHGAGVFVKFIIIIQFIKRDYT